MTEKTIKKVILFTLAALLVLGCMVPAGFASGNKKMLEAWYMNVKIRSNGQEVYTDTEPFIVDGTTYVPVRMMANIFNKDIQWDPINYIISVTDKPGSDLNYLNVQLMMKDNEIKFLEDKIKDLEGKSSTSDIGIDDLEDELNDYHDEYKGVDFDITLSGTKTKVTVKIEFSLKKDKTDWNKLTEKNVKSYLQDICDDILDEYPKAGISGYFKDSSGTTSSKMYQFSTSSKGVVSLDTEDDADLYDLEDDLNDMFYDYFGEFDVDIELEGDEDDITFNVYIDYDRYEDDWDDLRDRDIEYFMEEIYFEIEDVFDDADIVGYVYDWDGTTRLARYDPSRSTEFTRYH
jgi:hypothetical protein